MFLDQIISEKAGLAGMFASRSVQLHSILQYTLIQAELHCIVIDVNHHWTSGKMSGKMRIVQPKTMQELLDILQNLPEYLHSKLDLVVISDLPLYFRDYYTGKKIQTQNMRAYSASLALIKRISVSVPVIFTTYPNGINEEEPIYYNQSKYYSDSLFYFQQYNTDDIIIHDLMNSTTESILLERIHHDIKDHFY